MIRTPRSFSFRRSSRPRKASRRPTLDYEVPRQEVDPDADRPWWQELLEAIVLYGIVMGPSSRCS
jgi:hypothetical protein